MDVCLQCFDAVGWAAERASCLCWRGEVQTCIWPSWCHCHSLSLAPIKSRLVLPSWYRLTWVVPDKGPLNGCVCVCVCVCVHLPDRSEFRSTADRIGTTSSRYRRRDRRTWRYCDTGLTSRTRPPPYLLPTTPFAAAQSASEKKIENREYLANLQARAWLSRALCAPGQHTARRRRRCTRQSHSCL